MKPVDITLLIKKYGPGYVARDKKTGKVLAHHKEIEKLFAKVKHNKDIVISWVPKYGERFVFKVSFSI